MADTPSSTNQNTAPAARRARQNAPKLPPNPYNAIRHSQFHRANEWNRRQLAERRRDPNYVMQPLPESWAMPDPAVVQAAEEAYQEHARQRRALRERQTAKGNPPSREQEIQDMLESIVVLSHEQRKESYSLPAEKLDELLREWKAGTLKVHAMPMRVHEPARLGPTPERLALENRAANLTIQEAYQEALERRRQQRTTLTYGRDLPLPQVPRDGLFTVELGGVPDESKVKLGPEGFHNYAEAVEKRRKLLETPQIDYAARPPSPPSIDPRLLIQANDTSGSGM